MINYLSSVVSLRTYGY